VITNDNCFLELRDQDRYTLIPQITEFINGCEFNWQPYFYVYNYRENPCPEFLYTDPLISKLKSDLGGFFVFYKIPKHTVYRWHTDKKSLCCLNMVLKKYHSHTLFSIESMQDQVDHCIELDYKPTQWYLFNTQVKHMVVNLDDEDRYLITYRFNREDMPYARLFEWYQDYCKNSP
jgi:hypothetical protein